MPAVTDAVRVTWKDEDEVDGVPIGPISVVTAEQERRAREAEEAGILGRPYQPKCVCEGSYEALRERSTERNEWGFDICPDCGDELPEQWVTLRAARAIADQLGVPLETW